MSFEQFVKDVERAQDAALAYYNGESVSMTDDEYDALVEGLEVQAEQDERKAAYQPYLDLIFKVAAGQSESGDVPHDVPMLSLEKTKTFDRLLALQGSSSVIVEPKIDGSAISARYVDGELTQAVTRGNGVMGNDVSVSVLSSRVTLDGLPRHIPGFTGEIRGELYLTHQNFVAASDARVAFARGVWEETSAKRRKKDFVESDYRFSNARNAVSGLINSKNGPDYDVTLSFGAYDVVSAENDDSYFANMKRLASSGVQTALSLLPSEFWSVTTTDAQARVEKIEELIPDLGFAIDGAVIKVDSLSKREELGMASRHPRWALAYKFKDAPMETVVRDIIPTVGRTGRLALTAQVDLVVIETNITAASVHNVKWVQDRDLRIGDRVLMTRRNGVIPQIESIISHAENSEPWVPPAVCPKCGETWDKSSILWRCETPSCGAMNLVIHAAGRDYFDWDGMGKSIIMALFNEGKVNDIGDIFSLSVKDIAELVTGVNEQGTALTVGTITAQKIHDKIQESKKVDLSRVIASLGIRFVGRTLGKRLAKEFKNMDALRNASQARIAAVEGVGAVKAEHAYKGLRACSGIIDKLVAAGVNMEVDDTSKGNALEGKSVCVTGSVASAPALANLNRNDMKNLIESYGGRAASSVSSATHLLVAADSGSSKYTKAVSLGIQIVTPTEFAEMLNL